MPNSTSLFLKMEKDSCILYFPFFIAGDWTLGITHAKYVLHRWAIPQPLVLCISATPQNSPSYIHWGYILHLMQSFSYKYFYWSQVLSQLRDLLKWVSCICASMSCDLPHLHTQFWETFCNFLGSMQNSQGLKVVACRKNYAMKKTEEEGGDTAACLQLWKEGRCLGNCLSPGPSNE